MSEKKILDKILNFHLSMGAKITLGLVSVAVTLLISCIISVLEYTSMSNYVSTLIAEDIRSINIASKLSDMSGNYNLEVLAVIGDENLDELPYFDTEEFTERCISLRNAAAKKVVNPLSDSVMYSFSAYMLTSMELENVLESSFIDSRDWYFGRLQPRFKRLQRDISALSEAIYADLEKNSSTFERGFYRSVIPGIVAVGVGLLLILMLLLFLLAYYVRPLNRMLDSLSAYRMHDKQYNCRFDGDDQLSELNRGIAEIANENQQLRKRIFVLRTKK